MPRTRRASQGGYCYHVLNRGNARRTVFHKEGDYDSFLKLLLEAGERTPIRLLSSCLMPNHFHLAVWPVHDGDLSDAITTLGSGVDGAVRRIETAYDTQGNAYLLTSYDAATGGNVVNQVQREFNGLGQLITEWQATNGAVNTSTSPKVRICSEKAMHSKLPLASLSVMIAIGVPLRVRRSLRDEIVPASLPALRPSSFTARSKSTQLLTFRRPNNSAY